MIVVINMIRFCNHVALRGHVTFHITVFYGVKMRSFQYHSRTGSGAPMSKIRVLGVCLPVSQFHLFRKFVPISIVFTTFHIILSERFLWCHYAIISVSLHKSLQYDCNDTGTAVFYFWDSLAFEDCCIFSLYFTPFRKRIWLRVYQSMCVLPLHYY